VIALTANCDVDHGMILGLLFKLMIRVSLMPVDDRNLLDVLKFELEFLEQAGYGRLPREARRPRFVFEDSPTCMNFNSKDREPCDECLLMEFVPRDPRTEQTPCIHIPLSAAGETIASLYSTRTQQELEEALGAWLWLRATIRRLEARGTQATCPRNLPAPGRVVAGQKRIGCRKALPRDWARRAQQGVPLSRLNCAIILTKKNLWDFLKREAVLDRPTEISGELGVEELLDQLFDPATYYATVGYEQACVADEPVQRVSAVV
jgi:hypothetical protein